MEFFTISVSLSPDLLSSLQHRAAEKDMTVHEYIVATLTEEK